MEKKISFLPLTFLHTTGMTASDTRGEEETENELRLHPTKKREEREVEQRKIGNRFVGITGGISNFFSDPLSITGRRGRENIVDTKFQVYDPIPI